MELGTQPAQPSPKHTNHYQTPAVLRSVYAYAEYLVHIPPRETLKSHANVPSLEKIQRYITRTHRDAARSGSPLHGHLGLQFPQLGLLVVLFDSLLALGRVLCGVG